MRGFAHESTYNESKEWYTPREIFKALAIEFDLDPCSPGADIARWIPAKHHYTVEDDGFFKEWLGNIWLNPPYGKDTPCWLDKLSRHHGGGIALVFARTDTRWFHDYVPAADAICFIKGRIQFIPAEQASYYADGLISPTGGGCGAASILIAYGKENAQALYKSGLGLTLPVVTTLEMFRTDTGFAGGCRRPDENQPQHSEAGNVLFK